MHNSFGVGEEGVQLSAWETGQQARSTGNKGKEVGAAGRRVPVLVGACERRKNGLNLPF